LIAAYACLTYVPNAGLWVSIAGSLAIVACAWIAWPGEGLERVGLRLAPRQVLGTAVLLVAVFLLAWPLLERTAHGAEVEAVHVLALDSAPLLLLHTCGQTLNEELVLGALLLGLVRRWLPRSGTLAISVLVAALFTAFHYGFYALRPVGMPHHGELTLLSLLTLFAVGVMRNRLILASGHIGCAWAIHFGWNACFMAGAFRFRETGEPLDEPQLFNLLLGTPLTTGIAIGAAALTIALTRGSSRLGEPRTPPEA